MGTYRADIDGQTITFEAANDAAAGRYIDSRKSKPSVTANADATAQPANPVLAPTQNPPTPPLPPMRPEDANTMGALLRGDPGARARVEGYEQGRQMGVPAAAGMALQQGTLRNFQDEIGGLGAASGLPAGTPPIISAPVGAVRRMMGSAGAEEAYTDVVNRLRGAYEGASAANPVTTTVGEIGGGLAGPMPGSSIPAMAATAAADGALAGAGAGETAGGRAMNAAGGGVVGGALGGVLGLIGKGVGYLARGSAPQVEGEASRRVSGALRADWERMTPPERQAAMRGLDEAYSRGQPVVIGDAGGDTTRSLARAEANRSPQARQTMMEPLQERFDTQATRTRDWWDSVTGAPRAMETRDALQRTARAQNAPNYREAYAKGQSVWDEGLQQLTGSPTVQRAIKEASTLSADEAARTGAPMVRNPFQQTETGALVLPQGVTPSLEFWDHVQRGLRRMEEAAPRGGEEARSIGQLRGALNERLDAAVPEFATARTVARGFFGAEDALEAGQKFLDLPLRAGSDEARAAFNSLKPAEKQLFASGVVDSLRNRIGAVADNQEVSRIVNSPEMRERLTLALGEKRADEIANFLQVEKTMSQLKGAVGGNSTTARQLADLGLVGGAGVGAALGGAAGAAGSMLDSNGNLQLPSTGSVLGAVAAALTVRNQKTNIAVANRVADMLMSSDPAVLRRGAEILRNNKAMREGFNRLAGSVSRAAGQQAGQNWGAE